MCALYNICHKDACLWAGGFSLTVLQHVVAESYSTDPKVTGHVSDSAL